MTADKPFNGYSQGEEIANAVTHGAGMVVSIVGLVILLVRAIGRGDALSITSAALFGAALIALYGASALYHAIRNSRVKAVLQAVDHSMIYVLIAGTYSPLTLITLRGGWGWALFATVWALAAIGIVREVIWHGKPKWVSIVLYLSMGWAIIFAINPLMERLAPTGLKLLVAGGITYTVGTIFYGMKKVAYTHAIWHLFVVAGSVLHFLAVALYVV